MSTIAFLFDCLGRPVDSPEPFDARLLWKAEDGMALAYDASGKVIAELHHARVDFIDHRGIHLIGMEPIPPAGTAFRFQAWQCKP